MFQLRKNIWTRFCLNVSSSSCELWLCFTTLKSGTTGKVWNSKITGSPKRDICRKLFIPGFFGWANLRGVFHFLLIRNIKPEFHCKQPIDPFKCSYWLVLVMNFKFKTCRYRFGFWVHDMEIVRKMRCLQAYK